MLANFLSLLTYAFVGKLELNDLILIIGRPGEWEGDFFCVIRFFSVQVNEVGRHLTYIHINVNSLSSFGGSSAGVLRPVDWGLSWLGRHLPIYSCSDRCSSWCFDSFHFCCVAAKSTYWCTRSVPYTDPIKPFWLLIKNALTSVLLYSTDRGIWAEWFCPGMASMNSFGNLRSNGLQIRSLLLFASLSNSRT